MGGGDGQMVACGSLGVGIFDTFQVAGKGVAGIIVHIEAVTRKLLGTQEPDGQRLSRFAAKYIVMDGNDQIGEIQLFPVGILQFGRTCDLNAQNTTQFHLSLGALRQSGRIAVGLLQYVIFTAQTGFQLGGDHPGLHRLSVLSLQLILCHLIKFHLDGQGKCIVPIQGISTDRQTGPIGQGIPLISIGQEHLRAGLVRTGLGGHTGGKELGLHTGKDGIDRLIPRTVKAAYFDHPGVDIQISRLILKGIVAQPAPGDGDRITPISPLPVTQHRAPLHSGGGDGRRGIGKLPVLRQILQRIFIHGATVSVQLLLVLGSQLVFIEGKGKGAVWLAIAAGLILGRQGQGLGGYFQGVFRRLGYHQVRLGAPLAGDKQLGPIVGIYKQSFLIL